MSVSCFMKKYLLSWYGITDLGASLGLHGKDGPIWGALKTGEFSEAVVLAYTNPEKQANLVGPEQEDRLTELTEAQDGYSGFSEEEIWEFIDLFSNTNKAHRVYKRWLNANITAASLDVNVRVRPRELVALNDAKGIFEAVTDCIEDLLLDDEDKQLTVHLSPGTPLMAFIWAFASIRNPELDIRVISSSDHRKGPEEILLPLELMQSEIKGVSSPEQFPESFDAIFHLFGEQAIPGLLGIQQFKCSKHIFVTSGKYPADKMRQFIGQGTEFHQVKIDPFDPRETNLKILETIASLPPKSVLGFNLTGGTKLMYSGALEACRKVGGVPFYFKTARHQVVLLNDFSAVDAVDIPEVDMFLNLNGFQVVRSGHWHDDSHRDARESTTSFLWSNREVLQKIYYKVSFFNNEEMEGIPFQEEEGDVVASLSPDGTAKLSIKGKLFSFREFPKFAKYISGGWLEEYSYKCIRHLLENGFLKDLRIGLEVTWDFGSVEDPKDRAQEFDLLLTDGKKLIIIECKAGKGVTSADVEKLQNRVRKYGGSNAHGILVSAFPLMDTARRKLNEALNLSHCNGEDLAVLLQGEIQKRR
jgi:hypothetical protein